MIPEWLTCQRAGRGMCECCHSAAGQTFLHSIAGPLLCQGCASSYREDGRP
jgi:hypothetical protein